MTPYFSVTSNQNSNIRISYSHLVANFISIYCLWLATFSILFIRASNSATSTSHRQLGGLMSVAERVRCVRCIERGDACGGKPGKRCPLCSQNHRKCSFSRPIEPSPRVRNVPVCAGTKTTLVIDEDSDESKIEVTEEK
ncbi:hypothetical protein BDR07DRAFT_1424228 [Suillus spraguei]|nr:hypothetical protein BDR07DRAFT_1424228 [Suillus spraguei]